MALRISRRGALGALAAPLLSAQRRTDHRPNVLVILTDDQGYGDFDWHGNSQISTPNLRRLAEQSVEFTRFYVSPVCAPTRAAFLTGRYPLRTGVHGVTGGKETMRLDETTLAEMFLGSGYHTALVGKWHLGEQWPYTPAARGFEEFVGFHTGHWNRYFDSPVSLRFGHDRLKGYIADALTDKAIDAIDAHRRDPFFLYLAYNTPHSPFQVPDKYYDRHAAKGLPPDLASVYGMVENLDDNIGRLLQHLETRQLAKDTIVAFFCDNGPNTDRFRCGLRGRKGSVYEGGIRSPLLIRAPGLKPGKRDQIAAHIDLFPTLMSLAGIRTFRPLALDGVDLNAEPQSRFLFVHADHQKDPMSPVPGAVWDQRYKLVNRTELYDLIEDPVESKNIAEAQPERLARMRQAYDEWFAGMTQGLKLEVPPVEVGHPEEPEVELPATRASFKGDLQFREKFGYANDFLVGSGGTVGWRIQVATPAEYRVTIEYLSERGGVVEFGDGEKVLPANPPDRLQPIPLPDRKLRSPEAPEMLWQAKEIGRTELFLGLTMFQVRITGIMLKSIRLEPVRSLTKPKR